MDEMEEIWRDVAPGTNSSAQQPERVLDTGREAYLRTKQALDEASAVSSMLFLDDGRNDMSKRYQAEQTAHERDDSLDAAVGAGSGGWMAGTDRGHRASALFGESSLFLPTGEADSVSGGGRVSEGKGGGIWAAAAGGRAPLAVVDIRPEEKQFCDAFLELQNLMKRLPPGARARHKQMWPILQAMTSVSSAAEMAASDSAARLRELRGSGSSAVAVAAATAHELSLEKDTWSLLLYLNGADEEDENIKEVMRQDEEEANNRGSNIGSPRFAPPGPNASDQEVLRRMHHRDSEFRRTEAVVDWLQAAVDARSGTVDLGGMGMGMGMGGSHLGWSNTLESLAVAGGQKSEVGQMHPDANLRKVGRGSTGLKVMRLVGQDDLDEKELLRTAWLLVRTGKLGDAMRLCESRGQPWRAAAMGGGGVIGSGVLKEENVREQDDVDGEYGATYSPAQGLWQEMCWQLSVSLEKGADSSEGPARSVAKHEAALFAHLAGNTRLLLDSDLTQSWEDQAWVRFTALMHLKVLDERTRHRKEQAALSSGYPGVESLEVDMRLLEQMTQRAPPTNHGAIFEVLDDHSRGRVRAEGKGVYRQAQQALVLGGKDIPLFLRNILWRVAASGANEGGMGHGDGSDAAARPSSSSSSSPSSSPSPSPEVFRSPQLLRFAAHLALVLAAQCPYLTTMEEETVEAIEDVVFAYTQHLAKTHQVGLVAIYAATLPTRRRRELYAMFLRGVEGDANRREALEQANSQMPGDVPAILKKVVEDVRLQTVSVAPPEPRQVPEGDVKKIEAMSWLLDHPDTQAEAAVQANALARHLVLQKYQQSVIGGQAVGRNGRSWAAPLGDDANSDDLETPVVLSARLEAVKILLEAASSRGDEDVVVVGDDDDRERECWMLLLEAREAYAEWVAACRAREGGGVGEGEGDEDDEKAVRSAAERAMEALEGVLTFEDGWMYPTPRYEDAAGSIASVTQRARPAPNSETSSLGSWEHVDMDGERSAAGNPGGSGSGSDSGGGGGRGAVEGVPPDSMVVSFPNDEEEEKGESNWGPGDEVRVLEEKRKAKEVVEARQRREREEEESVRGMEEAARRAGKAAREEEMLCVRDACLPGLVFLTHEVAHDTGLWMLRWGSTDAAQGWFTRAQTLANMIVKDEYRTLLAMGPGQMEQFLHCVERSTTKLLECTEPRA